MNGWTWSYEGYDPGQEPLREALCTLANGRFATRGAAPESRADGTHYPGTYAAGCYNRLTSEVAGRTIENESIVNLPNWLPLGFRIEDGSWFDPALVDVLDYRLDLDLRRGLLTRRLRFRDDHGRTTTVVQRRFVHLELGHVAGLETTIVPEDWSGRLTVRSALDGNVENRGVARYHALASRHLEPVAAEAADDGVVRLVAQTTQSRILIAQAARTRASVNDDAVSAGRPVVDEAAIGLELDIHADAGDEIRVEKIVTLYTSRDPAMSDPAYEAVTWVRRLGGFDELLERHVLAWDHLWGRFRLDLDERDEALTILRLHLFHVLQTVAPHCVDLDVGVPARGLHGEAYRGLVFWDELFVLPLLNLRLPFISRALLGYRYRRLPEARSAAQLAGFAGAMYPWQSGSDGREESQRLHLNPASGRWLPDPTHRQRHIGIAVAYNVWQYYQSTGDREFLAQWGAEIVLEIARFWASAATYNHARDRYEIRGVMGPDEYQTAYPDRDEAGIDNNAYTNLMAVWVILRAMDVLDLLSSRRRRELTERLGLRREELQRWDEISRKMFVPFHGDGIISQFEGYEDLEDFDWAGYARKYGNIRRLDRILEAEGDTPNRYKASKQADVLMLFYLLSPTELCQLLTRLAYPFHEDMVAKNTDYYLDRTAHGSTLSALVHSWVLARVHRRETWDFFYELLESDIADIQGGTTPEGIHLAAMAGSIDLVQRCYAGLDTRGDVLWIDPRWPPDRGPLEFDVRYRDRQLTIRIDGERIRVSAADERGAPVKIGYGDRVVEVSTGETVEFGIR